MRYMHDPHSVYVARNADGAVLYVGCTANLGQAIGDGSESTKESTRND